MQIDTKIYFSIFTFSFLLLNIACEPKQSKREEETIKVITKDERGILQWEKCYIRNTRIEHGVCKDYYWPSPKNILREETEYRYGKKDGWSKAYLEDGTLESKIHFKNGLQDGMAYWYYKNGNIGIERFFIKGKRYGCGKFYYENGKLEGYNIYDFSEKVMYLLAYDENGNKIEEEGVVFSTNCMFLYADDSTETPIQKDKIKIGKKVIIKIPVAQFPNIPNRETNFKIREMGRDSMIELSIENYTATYTTIFTKKGQKTLIGIGKLYGWQDKQDMHLYQQDSVIVNVIE